METQRKRFWIRDFYVNNDRWGPLRVEPPMKGHREAVGRLREEPAAPEVWRPLDRTAWAPAGPSSSLLGLGWGSSHLSAGPYFQARGLATWWGEHRDCPRDTRQEMPSVQLPLENNSERKDLPKQTGRRYRDGVSASMEGFLEIHPQALLRLITGSRGQSLHKTWERSLIRVLGPKGCGLGKCSMLCTFHIHRMSVNSQRDR